MQGCFEFGGLCYGYGSRVQGASRLYLRFLSSLQSLTLKCGFRCGILVVGSAEVCVV